MSPFRPLILVAFSVVLIATLSSQELPINVEQAAAGWELDVKRAAVVPDEIAKAPAFHSTILKGGPLVFTAKAAVTAPVVLEAEVRLPSQVTALQKGGFSRANGMLGIVRPDSAIAGVTVSRGRFRDDVSYQADAKSGASGETVSYRITPKYSQDAISPLLEPNARFILEQRVGKEALAHERIQRLRLEARPDSVRMFVNGRFVAEYAGAMLPGKPMFSLMDDARLISLRVRPLESFAQSFVQVPLDEWCNADGKAEVSALGNERGVIREIEGVPFVKSAGFKGEDHLDLGPCVYVGRMDNYRDSDVRESVLQPEMMDPTRFRLRVPALTYRRAWVLAAFDNEPNSVPVLTIRFYRPRTGWTEDAVAEIPAYEAKSAPGQAKRVAMKDNRSLWLVPVDLDAAALAAQPIDCLEISKAMMPYRSWPDPAYYGSFPAGLPSGVRLYGLTLEEAPIRARGTGSQNGNLYPAPEKPIWRVLAQNLSGAKQEVGVEVKVTDPYGKSSTLTKKTELNPGEPERELKFEPATEVFGLYQVVTTVTAGDFRQSREGTFLKLPPTVRKATPQDSPWGLWCWMGGHDTNNSVDENARLLSALGAINNFAFQDAPDRKAEPVNLAEYRKEHGFGCIHYRLVPRQLPAWAMQDPYDKAEYAKYAEEKGKEAADLLRQHPDLQYVNFFAENHISLRVTHGMSPWAMGQPYFDYTPDEASRIRAHWVTAKAALEGVRKYAPSLKVIFGHGAGNFVQPFLRLPDWDNSLFDGFGMDLPQFERMPERQPRATEPSLLYFLHQQMKEKGLTDKRIVHLESYFPSSGPMALTFDEQAESVARTAVLSMSLGTTQFMRTWCLHTSGDGWGSSHYGSTGLIDRSPEFNPKPGAAAFATMSRVLDAAKYDGWVETGSRSAYCVRFKDTDRLVYAVWTVRGTRPLDLKTEGNAAITRYDYHGNGFPVEVKGNAASVTLNSMPQWLEVKGGSIASAAVGTPSYTEKPAEVHKLLENFETADWRYDPGVFERYQNNHWDMPREPEAMKAERVASSDRGSKVFHVELTSPDEKKPMVGFYGVFEPAQPIAIPGRAKALGVWVNGHSAWNRFIYQITDAKGEKWMSCGTKDAWNCDDIHSWSSVNHDGWRYMSFPMPSNSPGDNYREPDTTWWGSDGDGIVDLPVKLTRLMIEMRPQMIYADTMLPVDSLALELDDLTAEYASASDMTDQPVNLQLAAAKVLNPGAPVALPNPHADLQKNGSGSAPKIAKAYPPKEEYDGTRLFLEVEPVAGAARYRGYVAAYPDGRGAKPLAIDQQAGSRWAKTIEKPNVVLFDQLQPAMPLYFFVTTLDSEGKESKPSAIREVVLKDEFPFK